MGRLGLTAHSGAQTGRIMAVGLVLVLTSLLALTVSPALAQVDGPPVGSIVMVTNTDGQRLNLRAGPSLDQPIVGKLPAGETLTVSGAARTIGMTMWLPVTAPAGSSGWVSAEFVVLLSAPPASEPVTARTSTTASGESTENMSEQTEHDSRADSSGEPVDVEAKLKFPETDGRDQEITVWVTRDGEPVPDAIVTLESDDGDEDERFRQLDPTNAEGWTRRTFDVRREKGTVELRVEAVAPDGGEGRTIVSYFRR